MAIVLTNAILAEFDPPSVASGELRIDKGKFIDRGPSVSRETDDEIVDCGGAVVLPGMVNGHTHLYSALAVGMPSPPKTPSSFHEILKYVWWRLDRALDAESIEMSARIGAIQALRCGTTTLIDHHASPNHIGGALDLVEKGIADVGLRGVLCYETTDRNGPGGRAAGLDENRRYLERCKHSQTGRFAGLVGAHASFTLQDETLGNLSALAEQFDTGVHIHVAEDPCDAQNTMIYRDAPLIQRLASCFLLQPDAIFAHCTHLNAEGIAKVNEAGVYVAHNARSNMNNAVGYAPMASFEAPVMLGTDGIGADMFAEAKAAWFIAQHQKANRTPNDIVEMLANSARRATRALRVTLGRLEAGAAADVVISDYVPFTPLTSENLAGHLLFAMSSEQVRSVIVDGRWALRDRTVLTRDEKADRAESRGIARAMWERMTEIPC
jgi:putative selenium metabolism protein SsnA